MKSSKDIKSVPGMQLLFFGNDRRTAYPIGKKSQDGTGYHPETTNQYGWENGHYEIIWTPPTDEERQMFRDAAEHLRNPDPFGLDCDEFCHGIVGDTEWLEHCDYNGMTMAEICESLAMDGM